MSHSLFLAEELLMERCVLFERCELAPANERDRFLEHKQNKIASKIAIQFQGGIQGRISSLSVHQHMWTEQV